MIALLAVAAGLGSVGLAVLIGRAIRLGELRDRHAALRLGFLPTIETTSFGRVLQHDGPLTEGRAAEIRRSWAEWHGRRPDPWDAVLVRHDTVVERLPAAIRGDFAPPAARGWLTSAEAREHEGALVEVRNLAAREPRFYPTDGGIVR